MEAQWPLIVFTLFVCLTCGLLSGCAILTLKGKGDRELQLPVLVVATVSLVIGGLGSFTHLQHWERIFNGFGHITSGITQELIGCALLGVIIVLWIVALVVKKQGISKGVAIASIAVSVLMVVATGHSYLMHARPAWTLLIVFYLGSACLLGGVTLWLIALLTKQEVELAGECAKLAFLGSAAGLLTDVVYALSLAAFKVYDFGYTLDPTAMTTNPLHVNSLIGEAAMGAGAPMFWVGLITAALALVFVMFARKNADKTLVMSILAVICMLATSVCMRVLIYAVGFTSTLIY